MKAAIECLDIVKNFGDLRVLNGISLSVEEAKLFFLLGPSGCGKTTLLRIIAGLESADSGELFITGRNVGNLPPEKRGLGMVFQNYALWPHMNVYQHLEFGLKNSALTKHEIDKRIKAVLDMLQISQLSTRMPNQLSGGQQQRVSLARALVLQPKVLLLDEPLSNLDPYLREEMRSELKSVQRELGLTFIYVTHDRAEALAIGDRIAFMSAGKIIQQGKPTDLYFNPLNLEVASFLGEINLFNAKPAGNNILTFEFGNFTLNTANLSGQIHLAVRPEDIKLSDGLHYKASACLISILHLGYGSQLLLQTESGLKVRATVSMKEAIQLQEGQIISIGFNPEDIKVL